MPVKLNLLPPELAVGKSLSSFLKALRKLDVIGIAAFLIFGTGVGIFFIVSTISLNGINANVSTLESKVSAQQKSEQQLILIKDRVEKIASIQGLPSALPNLKIIEPFLSNLSVNSSVNEMSIDSASTNLSVTLQTNSDLTAYIESLESSNVFGSVDLTSFNLSPGTGYSVAIKATKK